MPHALSSSNSLSEAATRTAPANPLKTIAVVGLGYVGLPTALLFAQHGFRVHGVDIDPDMVHLIQAEGIESAFPELADWAEAVYNKNEATPTLTATTECPSADVFILTVPTPVDPLTKHCDLSAVRSATAAVSKVLQPGNLVILESTVPPGTTSQVVRPILEQTGLSAETDFHLCFCPERILPGNTCYELVNNHRILGGHTPEAAALAETLFKQVIQGELYQTDAKSAEFSKLAENTYRDVNIALANELSLVADEHGIDLKAIQPLINKHPRVNMLTPGIGVGGHCIAVDPWFFVEVSPWKTSLIRTSRDVNSRMPEYCVQKILTAIQHIENPVVVCAGLTYKPNVADTRESPALMMVELLKARGIMVRPYDPLLRAFDHQSLVNVTKDADYLAVLVNHDTLIDELETDEVAIQMAMRTPLIHRF